MNRLFCKYCGERVYSEHPGRICTSCITNGIPCEECAHHEWERKLRGWICGNCRWFTATDPYPPKDGPGGPEASCPIHGTSNMLDGVCHGTHVISSEEARK